MWKAGDESDDPIQMAVSRRYANRAGDNMCQYI